MYILYNNIIFYTVHLLVHTCSKDIEDISIELLIPLTAKPKYSSLISCLVPTYNFAVTHFEECYESNPGRNFKNF